MPSAKETKSGSSSSSGTITPVSDDINTSGKSKSNLSSKNHSDKSGSKSKSSKNKSSGSKNNTSSIMNKVPQTPFGGHDPTALNAPVFAKAAEQNATGDQGNGYDHSPKGNSAEGEKEGAEIMDDVPQTPLGGHDPTASNAPSYAQATNY